MNDKVANSNAAVSIPVTWGELEVIRSVASYHIPLLLGFGAFSPIIQNGEHGSSASSGSSSSAPPVW
jgi:hypothetical protein